MGGLEEEGQFYSNMHKQSQKNQEDIDFDLSQSNASKSFFTNNSQVPNFYHGQSTQSKPILSNPAINTGALEAKIKRDLQIEYQEKIQNLEYEIKDLTNENKDLKVNMDFYKNERNKFKLQLSDIDLDEVEQIRADLKRYKQKNLDLQKDYKNLEQQKMKIQDELTQYKKMQDQEKNDTFHSMREQRSKENAIREKFDREISNYKEKLTIMERENETLRSQLKYGQFASNNKEDNMELEYKIESLTNENKRILKENSDLAEEAKEYKLKVFDLKDEKEDLLVQLDDNKEKYKEKNESFRKILTKKDDEVTNLKQQNLDLIQKVEEYKHENFQTTQNTEWYEKD